MLYLSVISVYIKFGLLCFQGINFSFYMDYCVGSFLKTCVEPTYACIGTPYVGDVNQAKLPCQEKKRGSYMSQPSSEQKQQK
jgi:hypothetical protein